MAEGRWYRADGTGQMVEAAEGRPETQRDRHRMCVCVEEGGGGGGRGGEERRARGERVSMLKVRAAADPATTEAIRVKSCGHTPLSLIFPARDTPV